VARTRTTAAGPVTNGKPRPTRSVELVEVAARLFRDRGYDATSMQEIADEMGILKGSVYHYVKTKEDLLWMVVEPPLRELVDTARVILDEPDVPLVERLHRAMEAHAKSFEGHYPHMFVITRENGDTLSPARRKDFNALRAEYFRLFETAIAKGQETGELRSDIEPRLVVQAIFGMLNWMFRWFKPRSQTSATDVADAFGAILAGGIVARPS
jgi:AcrR family transcriptional regulator